jgi:hypothetical protein
MTAVAPKQTDLSSLLTEYQFSWLRADIQSPLRSSAGEILSDPRNRFDTRAIRSFVRERKSLRSGEDLALWKPRTRSIVGARPANGRLTTDRGRKFNAYTGNKATPPVEATTEIAMERPATS